MMCGFLSTSDVDSQPSKVEAVQEYYGKQLKKSSDLKTNACCTGERPSKHMREVLSNIADEVLSKYYGCGLVCPENIFGKRILDLGCGAGRDVYALAQLVGESGSVVGVDITDEQLEVAEKYVEHHRVAFGYSKSNVEFLKGRIERLDEIGLQDESFDIVVSNCVVNLVLDKGAVLKQVHRILKKGGEFYFSDVYSDRHVPNALREDPVLWSECLSGALYWNEFERLAQRCGFTDPRLLKDSPIRPRDSNLEASIGHIGFFSATYRLFKLPDLDIDQEDYGQAVIYKGTIDEFHRDWFLDKNQKFSKAKVAPVSGNTWRMLAETRFKDHFDFVGDFSVHFGIFPGQGRTLPFGDANLESKNSSACC